MKRICLIIAVITMLEMFCISAFSSGEKNIALGLKYTVEGGTSDKYSYARHQESDEKYYSQYNICLTDGKLAEKNLSASGYYKAFRGVSRLVCFDFGKEMSISGFGASFFHAGSGIYMPRYIKLWLSDDGENYVLVAEKDTTPIFSASGYKKKHTCDIGKSYKARYAKVEFEVGVFAYCDEIEIYGSDNTEKCERLPEPAKAEEKGYYPKFSEKMNKAGSIIKIYDGYYPADQSIADNSADELLPYIAYMNKQGGILDTMFDSVAFVPCHTDYPSGGRLVQTSGKPGGIMSDWEEYISHTFKPNYNLDALEKATAKRNEALKISEKTKVFLTIPYPMVQTKPFGDVDGDGKTEYSNTLESRVKIIRWYVEKVVAEFEKKSYTCLELAGFYWYREEVGFADSDHDDELIRQTKEVIEAVSPSCCLLFDPFYLSVGFDSWQDYGFDGCVMQPNLVFRDYFKTEMLGEFAEQIKKAGVGVEVETAEPHQFKDSGSNKKYGKIYENYLYYGQKTGYMSSLHTFYQGAGPGSIYKFLYSDDSYLNYLYDITYKYIKETLSFPEIETDLKDNYEFEADSEKNRMEYVLKTEGYKPNISVEVETDFGKTSVRGFTSLAYTPPKGFNGVDRVKVKFTDGLNNTTEKILYIKVGNGKIESSAGYCGVENAKKGIAKAKGN